MPHSVLAVAESDSYLKWAVSLLAQLPPDARIEVVIARSPIRPSAAQQAGALAGTEWAGATLPVLSPAQLRRRVDRDRPDAVLLACTGPTVHAYGEVLSRARHRPVMLAGIPGIALPARRKAWQFRGGIDLMVVHSHREAEEYDRVRELTGKTARIGLATIPFLAPDAQRLAEVSGGVPIIDPAARPHIRPRRRTSGRGGRTSGRCAAASPAVRNRVLFATQGKVPVKRADRESILLSLAELARRRRDLRVVVKTRGVPGEFHTHYEQFHYELLWRDLISSGRVEDGSLLQFAAGSMAEQLRTAQALVTVSSTAVLEAMALDVPVLLIDDFGVSEEMINEVFVASGVQRGLADLTQADFRHPEPWWSRENYFHPVTDNTWVDLLDELVKLAADGQLPALAEGSTPAGPRNGGGSTGFG